MQLIRANTILLLRERTGKYSTKNSVCVHGVYSRFDLIFGVLMLLSNIFQLYHGEKFWWWNKSEYPERTTLTSWVRIPLSHGIPGTRWSIVWFITQCCIGYTSLWTRFEFTTLVVIGTHCTGSYTSNNHTITSTATRRIYLIISCKIISFNECIFI
jgi:hypothetical protein